MVPTNGQLSPHILQAVHKEQISGLVPLNRIRFWGVTSVVALYMFLEFVLVSPNWSGFLPLLIGYWFVSLGIFYVSKQGVDKQGWTALAIPIVDTPVVFMHEFRTLEMIDPQGTAGFALGVFALLIVLSSITMRHRLVWCVLGLAVMMEVTLMYLAAMEVGSMAGGVVILTLLAVSVVTLITRVTNLIVVATEENARVDSLSRFLAPAVMKEINSADSRALRGSELIITVLFADIRGFTTLSEHLAPEQVVGLLNDYFSRMSTVIFRHGGTLDKFVGDGLMAYFGAPVAQDDQADRAVRCAIEMQQALSFLNVEREGRGESAIRIGIGMHTGSAMVGIIGSDKRKEYTAVGDTVNVAARVEGLTKEYGRPLLVSAATLDLAKGTYEVDRVGDIEIRGRVKSLEMFAIQETEFEGERQSSQTKKGAMKRGTGESAQLVRRPSTHALDHSGV